jgi:hypothetical protein
VMSFDLTGTRLLGTALDATHVYDTETCSLLAVSFERCVWQQNLPHEWMDG